MTTASEIPTAYTPAGGWKGEMPPPILAGCTEPLVDGAPDLRGLWKVVDAEVRGERAPDHPVIGHIERIEQAGFQRVLCSHEDFEFETDLLSFRHIARDRAACSQLTALSDDAHRRGLERIDADLNNTSGAPASFSNPFSTVKIIADKLRGV